MTRFESAERCRQHALDGDHAAVRKRSSLGDRTRRRSRRGSRGRRRRRRGRRSRSRSRRRRGGRCTAGARCRRGGRCRRRRGGRCRRRSGSRARGGSRLAPASWTARDRRRRDRRRRRGHDPRHRRSSQTLWRWRALDEPIGHVVIRVRPVAGLAARRSLDARAGGRRRRQQTPPRTSCSRRPSRRHRSACHPTDAERDRPTGRGEPARIRRVGDGRDTRQPRSRSGCACPDRGSSTSTRSPCASRSSRSTVA